MVWDYFERTPPMSTYTVGLVVADLELLDNFTKHRSIEGEHICEHSALGDSRHCATLFIFLSLRMSS